MSEFDRDMASFQGSRASTRATMKDTTKRKPRRTALRSAKRTTANGQAAKIEIVETSSSDPSLANCVVDESEPIFQVWGWLHGLFAYWVNKCWCGWIDSFQEIFSQTCLWYNIITDTILQTNIFFDFNMIRVLGSKTELTTKYLIKIGQCSYHNSKRESYHNSKRESYHNSKRESYHNSKRESFFGGCSG